MMINDARKNAAQSFDASGAGQILFPQVAQSHLHGCDDVRLLRLQLGKAVVGNPTTAASCR
jgi:hypothetical protein